MTEEVVKGKVVHKGGKYFLDVAGKMEAFPDGPLADEGVLKEMVGQEVEVFYLKPKPAVLVVRDKGRRVPILCNIPVPDLIGTIITKPSVGRMRTAINKLYKQGAITEKVRDTILQGLD